jgi:hypothetical protein
MEPRPDLVDRIAQRAHLPQGKVREVLDAMAHLDDPADPAPLDHAAELLQRAQHHALGLAFLLEGNIESVAITFGTHAFHVEEARRRFAAHAGRPTTG